MSKAVLSPKIKSKKDANGAKPFLKWAGGKSQLLSQFEQYYPEELKSGKIQKYVEPFLGGGAVFFDIVSKYKLEKAYLFDINKELVLAYKVIQRNPEQLIDKLDIYSEKYQGMNQEQRKQYFYEIRDKYNNELENINFNKYSYEWISRAAQIMFLNKTCFNGLFRVNKKGHFNVPFGQYKNPRISDDQNILAVSNALKTVEIYTGIFQDCEKYIDNSTFVYFDPPYRPISQTSSFTSYSKHEFNDNNQVELGKFFELLDKRYKAKLMLSNSDPSNIDSNDKFFDSLFKNYRIKKVLANRMINCNAEKRGQIKELLILNY